MIAGRKDKDHKEKGAITLERLRQLLQWLETQVHLPRCLVDAHILSIIYSLGSRACQYRTLVTVRS